MDKDIIKDIENDNEGKDALFEAFERAIAGQSILNYVPVMIRAVYLENNYTERPFLKYNLQITAKTFVPSAISIIFTGARVPLAYILSRPEHLGLNGIWWSISISSMFKGILLLGTFIVLYKYKKINNSDSI